MKRYDSTEKFEEIKQLLSDRTKLDSQQVRQTVRDIIHNIRETGDAALLSYIERFDGKKVTEKTLCLGRDAMKKAYDAADPNLMTALEKAAANIRAFHEKQLQNGFMIQSEGMRLGQLVRPLETVGVYVPGGTAARCV